MDPQVIEIAVEVADIFSYIGDSQRPVRLGTDLYTCGHIGIIGYTETGPGYILIKAYVYRSSNPNLMPHELTLKVFENWRYWDLYCSCKANTGRCKHIVSCLFYLSKIREIEYLSCTDVRQAWGVSKNVSHGLWGPRRIKDLCCVKKKEKWSPPVDDPDYEETLNHCFSEILSVCDNSAIANHIRGRHLNDLQIDPEDFPVLNDMNVVPRRLPREPDFSDFCSKEELMDLIFNEDYSMYLDSNELDGGFYKKNVCVSLERCVEIAWESMGQENNIWLYERSIRITASSAYGLLTYSKKNHPDEDWRKKIQNYLNPKQFKLVQLNYGKNTESEAFQAYRMKSNPLIKKCGFVIHPLECWVGGSPDGIDPLCRVVLEIKCPVLGADFDVQYLLEKCQNTKKYVKSSGSDVKTYELNKKHMYYCQVQINMWILNCKICDFIIYSSKSKDYFKIEVPYDKEFIEEFINALKPVYFERILPAIIAKCYNNPK